MSLWGSEPRPQLLFLYFCWCSISSSCPLWPVSKRPFEPWGPAFVCLVHTTTPPLPLLAVTNRSINVIFINSTISKKYQCSYKINILFISEKKNENRTKIDCGTWREYQFWEKMGKIETNLIFTIFRYPLEPSSTFLGQRTQ